MPTGRIVVWNKGVRSGQFFGYIRDGELGAAAPREANVYFEEGDLSDQFDRTDIDRNMRVSFEYAAPTAARVGQNQRGQNVRPIDEPALIGTVAAIKPHETGFYGFIAGDGASDVYFNSHSMASGEVPRVGRRVRYVVDASSNKPRAVRVETITP